MSVNSSWFLGKDRSSRGEALLFSGLRSPALSFAFVLSGTGTPLTAAFTRSLARIDARAVDIGINNSSIGHGPSHSQDSRDGSSE